MSEEKKFYYPNTTQKPNIVFDVIMRKIGKEKPLAYLVLDAIIRKIYGWGKQEDNISNSQIVEMTGLSSDTVRDCLNYLIIEKFIEQTVKGQGRIISRYRLTLNEYIVNNSEVASSNPSNIDHLPAATSQVVSSNLTGSQNLHTKPTLKTYLTKNKEEEEKPSTPEKVLEKKKEESSFVNQMLDLKDVVSSPVMNRQEAFQRMVNTIGRIKKREKGQLVGYDSMNKNETANLYCLVDQFEGNENVVLQILETMLEYQNSGKLKLYSEILRTTTKHTNPNFWNQATISAFYIVKFASDKEVIDTAIRENEIYQEHLKRKKEQATFTKSPEAKLNIPIDTEFAKQLKELKDKPVEQVDELEVKRHADLEKMKSVLAATPKKSNFEIEREQEEKRKEILMKIELQKKVV